MAKTKEYAAALSQDIREKSTEKVRVSHILSL